MALVKAVSKGDVEKVEDLLAAGTSPNDTDKRQQVLKSIQH